MAKLDLSTPEAQEAYEAEARLFAEITIEAKDMVPLLTQKFEMRIKSGVPNPLGWSLHQDSDCLLLGKWIEVSVDWEMSLDSCFLVLRYKNTLLQFTDNEFKKHITKKGIAPKMFKTFLLALK